MTQSILSKDKNCWRIARAERAGILIDAANYFRAFYESLSQARKYVLIAGWEMNSRFKLIRDDRDREHPVTFGTFLNSLTQSNPDLDIYILAWDFSMIYLMEREPTPLFEMDFSRSGKIHFHFDDVHPIGGSHHQKIVVVDGNIAFCGGLDLTQNRWDTQEHTVDDPRRVAPDGTPFRPFHDVQMIVDGEAASALGELFAYRWRRATGNDLSDIGKKIQSDPWPESYQPDFNDVSLGISRTLPSYKGQAQVKEVKQLHLDAIAAARDYIYMENQYFTSPVIQNALMARLKEENGPEIIIVLPQRSMGWLEESTMDAIRSKILLELYDNDVHGRLGAFYAHSDGLVQGCIKVHSKILIVDDAVLKVGSSNLSNRSMGLDSECDLVLESGGDHTISQGIRTTLHRLLADHLGTTTPRIPEILKGKSLLDSLNNLPKNSKTLLPFDKNFLSSFNNLPIDYDLVDPEQPIKLDRLMDRFVQEDGEKSGSRSGLLKFGLVLLFFSVMAALWRWTPLSEYLNVDNLIAWSEFLKDRAPLAPFVTVGAYVFGSLIVFPVTVLIAVTAAVFSTFHSLLYTYTGVILSSLATYWIGRWMGREKVRNLTGSRINRLSKKLAQQGILTVALVRMIPIAPFTIINLVAGASHIRFRDYMLGTILGMTPGILAITFFTGQLFAFFRHPDWKTFFTLTGLTLVIIALGVWIKKRLSKKV